MLLISVPVIVTIGVMGNIKLICFDLNKTLINENSWLDLNLALGMTKKEDQELFEQWERGKISYQQWQKKIEKIYKKRGKATLKNVTKAISGYTYKKGAKEIVQYLKDKDYKIAIISGSMDILVKIVAKELGIELFKAGNELVFNDKGYLKRIISYGEDSEVKLEQLKEICSKVNVKLEECACIGDGENDRLLFKKTGNGVTFKGSKLEGIAWRVIEELSDLGNMF